MPSGAKKRKASKKKMKKEAQNGNHSNVNHSQENEEPRSHDERESDGGEVDREEEDEKREIDSKGNTDREEVLKETIVGEENVVDVEMGVKQVDVDDEVKKTPHGDPSVENGIASSDVAVEKVQTVLEEVEESREQDCVITETVPGERVVMPAEYLPEMAAGAVGGTSVEEVSNIMKERIPEVVSVKQVVPLPEEVNLVTESAPLEILVSGLVDPQLKESENEVLQLLDEKDRVPSITTDFEPEKIVEEVTQLVACDSAKSSTIVGFLETENEDEIPELESSGTPVVDISPVVDVVKGLQPLEQLQDEIGAIVVDRSCRVDNIESVKHNEHSVDQIGAPSVGENHAVDYVESMKTTEQFEEGVSAPDVDTSHRVGDVKDLKIHEQSKEQMGAPAVDTSPVMDDVKEMKIHEQSNQPMASSAVDSSQGVEQIKDLEAHENLEGQSLISSAPRAAQRNSWMTCCGLLEVFSGSHS